MRITRETLLKLARDTVQMQVQRDRRLICVYLTGSLLTDDPLLGGTTDIDLVFIHDSEPLYEREITRLSDEVHLDIAHHSQTVFHQPRHLRVDPWIGPFLCQTPLVLHDSHHWFEFTQASVCAQFNQPDYVYQRVSALAAQARQTWLDLHLGNISGETRTVWMYLKALENAANAIASFSGPPLTERRLLLQFPQCAKELDRPGLAAGLSDLLLSDPVQESDWRAWQPAWQAALDSAGRLENVPPPLMPCRKGYYTRAAASLWDKEPAAAIWIALRSWTRALEVLGEQSPDLAAWRSALQTLGLDGQSFQKRLELLDTYVDNIEELLETWAHEYGIETNI